MGATHKPPLARTLNPNQYKPYRCFRKKNVILLPRGRSKRRDPFNEPLDGLSEPKTGDTSPEDRELRALTSDRLVSKCGETDERGECPNESAEPEVIPVSWASLIH